jgi:hypothetical protein
VARTFEVLKEEMAKKKNGILRNIQSSIPRSRSSITNETENPKKVYSTKRFQDKKSFSIGSNRSRSNHLNSRGTETQSYQNFNQLNPQLQSQDNNNRQLQSHNNLTSYYQATETQK